MYQLSTNFFDPDIRVNSFDLITEISVRKLSDKDYFSHGNIGIIYCQERRKSCSDKKLLVSKLFFESQKVELL